MLNSRVLRWGVCAVAMLVIALTPAAAQDDGASPDPEALCETIMARAVTATTGDCEPTARNEACYGYAEITVDYQAGIDAAAYPFEVSGDITPLAALRKIATAPLDVDAGTWGMSVVKFQANLPHTRPGENVTFILFGDTQVENVSGDLSAIYLTNGLGHLVCNTIPEDALVVRAPQGLEVGFVVNGVEVRLGSAALMQAHAGGMLSVGVIEGYGSMTVDGQTVFIPAGYHAQVPLSADGQMPMGTLGAAEPGLFDRRYEEVMGALTVLQPGAVPEGAVPMRLEGVVEAINMVSNTVVVYGYAIPLSRAQLAALQVGQWIVIEGYFDGGNLVVPFTADAVSSMASDVIIVASPTPTPTPTPTPLPPPPDAPSRPNPPKLTVEPPEPRCPEFALPEGGQWGGGVDEIALLSPGPVYYQWQVVIGETYADGGGGTLNTGDSFIIRYPEFWGDYGLANDEGRYTANVTLFAGNCVYGWEWWVFTEIAQ